MKEVVRQNERLRVAAPPAGSRAPACSRSCAIRNATGERAAVVPLPETQIRARANRIDPGGEAVATFAHLPLHRARGRASEGDGKGAVILGAAVCLWARGAGEVAADVAGVKLDGVQPGIHIEPGIAGDASHGGICVTAAEDAAVAAF
jgi:hypothetical protein